MRGLSLLLLTVAALQGQQPGASQPPPRMLLSAVMEAKSVKLGSAINVNFLLQSISSQPVVVVDTFVPAEYELMVTDASGKELPRTRTGEAIQRGEFPCFKCESVVLNLFEAKGDSMDLREIYQFNESGTYSLRATRRGRIYPTSPNEKAESVSATSDVVQFTITP